MQRRVGLTILYIVLMSSILLAFPQKWGSEELLSTFSSAPKTAVASNKFSVSIIGAVNTRNRSGQKSSISTGNKVPNTVTGWAVKNTVIKKQNISCAQINVCQKIHFSDTYTNSQKIKYYNALLQILSSLTTILPQSPSLTSTLFSITLTPDNTNNERRWRGGSKTILLQTKNMTTLQEFREVLTHELAHIIDLGMLTGKSESKDTNFTISENTYFSSDDPSLSFYQLSWENSTTRLANASYLDFVWGYAMSSPYEDFAEAFTMYIWHNEVFKQRAAWSTVLQKKYNFMHNLTQGQSLSNSTTNIQNNISWRPWDVTRISLE